MASYSLTTATNLFKIKYDKLSDNTYNSATATWSRIKKNNKFTGRRMEVSVPTTFGGGVGSGRLPTANSGKWEMAQITSKKVYATIEVDRESIKAAQDDEGAFVRLTKESVRKGVESCMRNLSRILFNDGTGALGTLNANATGTAAAPIAVVSLATWKEANWEEKDYINFGTDASVFEVMDVAPATRTVTLSRISGTLDLTATGNGLIAYMQNSKDNDPSGLKGVLDATGSNLYSVPVARRWQAGSQIDAGGAGVTTDLLNQAMLEIQRKCGKVPNLIVTSYTQYRKIKNMLEDQKQYVIEPRSKDLQGKISFKGLEFMSDNGAVAITPERFVDDDRIYFLNDNYIEVYNRPDWGWFDDDGTIFLRKSGEDVYEARYGGYCEIYIPPSFHGRIKGLAV